MALTFHTYKFLELLNNNNENFGEVLSLGQINNLISKDDFKKLKIPEIKDKYSNKILLDNFNIKSVNSLDYSNFEGADLIHDLKKGKYL